MGDMVVGCNALVGEAVGGIGVGLKVGLATGLEAIVVGIVEVGATVSVGRGMVTCVACAERLVAAGVVVAAGAASVTASATLPTTRSRGMAA